MAPENEPSQKEINLPPQRQVYIWLHTRAFHGVRISVDDGNDIMLFVTPWNISRLEPLKNDPIEKGNHFESNLHFWGSMLIFQGVIEISRWPGGQKCVSLCAGNLAKKMSILTYNHLAIIKPSSPIQLTAIHHRFET